MPEKPELEAVAYRTRADRGWAYTSWPTPDLGGSLSEPLTPLTAAQALLAIRDEQIAELEATLRRANSLIDSQNEAVDQMLKDGREIDQLLSDILAMLAEHTNAECRAATAAHDAEIKLTRLRPIVRAAVQLQQSEAWAHLADRFSIPFEFIKLADAIDAFSEEELAELLKGEE